MRRLLLPALFISCLFLTGYGSAQTAEQTRQALTENQRNILHLQKEIRQMERQLSAAKRRQQQKDSTSIQNTILELEANIDLTKLIIDNIAAVVSGQRLMLATLESGKSPSSLDIALNKALSSNLPELAKDFSNNEQAQREIARLQKLLREEALLGIRSTDNNSLVLATDQQTAEQEFLHLIALFSDLDLQQAELVPDKNIRISGKKHGKSYVEKDTLSYLGRQQYHMEFTAHQGEMNIKVEGQQALSVNIPQKDDGATYIMIYDITNPLRPRVVMFNKSLVVVE
jgi:hypothetical protein